MFLNWSVKSAGYAAQKCVVRPFWEGHGLFTAKETTSTKNVILNAFLMRDFYFKRHAGKLLTLSDHLTQMQSKERKSAWEKRAVPIQYLRSDEMLTGLISVALFYRYFRNLLWINKYLTSEKNELSCQMLYCAGGARSSIALTRTQHHTVTLYNFTKVQKLQACSSTVQ